MIDTVPPQERLLQEVVEARELARRYFFTNPPVALRLRDLERHEWLVDGTGRGPTRRHRRRRSVP